MAKKQLDAIDQNLIDRQKNAIAQNALTNSKRPECFVKGVYPTHVVRGNQCYLWDSKGNRYIDFICGMGTNILGYNNPEIEQTVISTIRDGVTLSLSTPVEIECAETVKTLFKFVDRVKFFKNGSDACTAALRIARTYNNREFVLSEGYHGAHDAFVSLTPPALGIAGNHKLLKLPTELETIEWSRVSAVIVEPVMTDMGYERVKWLNALSEACTKHGVVLIFDEIITGFRTPKMCMSNFLGIEPDLICLGKAMANGFPLSAVGGKQALMECDEYFYSQTFAGERLSLAVATKTMKLLQERFQLDHLWREGGKFIKHFNELAPGLITLEGYPTRGVFKGDLEFRAVFWQECIRAGILFGPSFFFNFWHIDVADIVLHTCKDIIQKIKHNNVRLDGELPKTPFAQKQRG